MNFKIKSIITRLPEIIFFVLLIMYWFSTTFLNPIAIVLIIVLLLKIYKNNKIIDITISLILFLVSIYFFFALMSEFSDFNNLNSEALNMLYVGVPIFLVVFIASVSMFLQSLKKYELI